MKKYAIIAAGILFPVVGLVAYYYNLTPWYARFWGFSTMTGIWIVSYALYKGRHMSPSFLPRNRIFQLRAAYRNDNGTYTFIDFGNGKIIPIFLKDVFASLTVGYYYIFDGKNFTSHKEAE